MTVRARPRVDVAHGTRRYHESAADVGRWNVPRFVATMAAMHLRRALLAALLAAGCDESNTRPAGDGAVDVAAPNDLAPPVDAVTVTDAPTTDGGVAPCTEAAGPFAPWSTRCGQIVDDAGRVVVVHGINARIAGVFDVTLSGGRAPVEAIPTFGASDAAQMRSMGFNLLRLSMHWSGVEPDVDGGYDGAYLDRVAAVVGLARSGGLKVLLDFHQDAYSKEIGEDGAPLWAIVPAPTQLLSGPLNDLGDRRQSAQVLAAFHTFFGDGAEGDRLRARFTQMAAAVATRFRGDDTVVGYEIYNEPIALESQVQRLSVQVATALRAADPGHLVFFEPDSSGRAVVNHSARPTARFPVTGAVYAPHTYPLAFTGTPAQLASFTVETLRPATESARAEADLWGTPLVVTEWGFDPRSDRAPDYYRFMQDLQAEYQAGAMYWVWKEQVQGAWGLFDIDAASGAWSVRPAARRLLARVRPESIAGVPVSWAYDGAAHRLVLRVTARDDRRGPHRIYVPDAADFAPSFTVTCDGMAANAARDPSTGIVTVTCGGADGSAHEVVVQGS